MKNKIPFFIQIKDKRESLHWFDQYKWQMQKTKGGEQENRIWVGGFDRTLMCRVS